jgi:hypothetical protein
LTNELTLDFLYCFFINAILLQVGEISLGVHSGRWCDLLACNSNMVAWSDEQPGVAMPASNGSSQNTLRCHLPCALLPDLFQHAPDGQHQRAACSQVAMSVLRNPVSPAITGHCLPCLPALV